MEEIKERSQQLVECLNLDSPLDNIIDLFHYMNKYLQD